MSKSIKTTLYNQYVFMKCIMCALYWTKVSDPWFQKENIFLSQFCLIFLLILSLYDSIFTSYDRLLNNDNIIFGFCSNFSSFCYTLENNWYKLINSLFRCIAKTCRIIAKPNNRLILWSQLSFLAFIESNRLRTKRKMKQNLNKNWVENLSLKLRFTDI